VVGGIVRVVAAAATAADHVLPFNYYLASLSWRIRFVRSCIFALSLRSTYQLLV